MPTNTEIDIGPTWERVLGDELNKPYFLELARFLEEERKLFPFSVYPPKELVFNALKTTSYDEVKVVIIGQDPYHGRGQADGLAFSVPAGVRPPPSLKNIFKELSADLGSPSKNEGCLISWAKQGVLLLNATLTVRQSHPLSHHGKGWECFTDAVVDCLIKRADPPLFVLWGKSAQTKCKQLLDCRIAKLPEVITAPHPSPFSAYQGFFGSKPFSKINDYLRKNGKTPIDW